MGPPATVVVEELEHFRLSFTIHNAGTTTVDPQLESSMLFVDGMPVADWDLIIGNGPRDDRWQALPAGEQLEFSYRLGDRLFSRTGDYTLRFETGGQSSKPLTVPVGSGPL